MAAYQVMCFLLLGGCDNKTFYYSHGISTSTLMQMSQILLGTMPDRHIHGQPLGEFLQSNFSEKLESLYVTFVADMETIDAQYRLSCI